MVNQVKFQVKYQLDHGKQCSEWVSILSKVRTLCLPIPYMSCDGHAAHLQLDNCPVVPCKPYQFITPEGMNIIGRRKMTTDRGVLY